MTMPEPTSGPSPRSNILAGEPVKWRVKALDAFLRPWFARGVFRGMGVLCTIGRRSGKVRRHAIVLVHRGNKIYFVSIPGRHANWLWNIRANPRVEVELRGGRVVGTARELGVESLERAEAKQAFVGTVHPANYLECLIHWRGLPARWKIQRLHEMWFEGGVPLVVDVK